MKLKPVTGQRSIRLGESQARVRSAMREDELERETAKYSDRISKMQRVFYADARMLIARAIVDRLATLRLRYPPADPSILGLEIT